MYCPSVIPPEIPCIHTPRAEGRQINQSPGLAQASFHFSRAPCLPSLLSFLGRPTLLYVIFSVSAYWWRNQQVSVSQGSAQEFAKKLVDRGADAVFKASDLDGDGTLSQDEFSLAIADQQMGFAKFEVRSRYLRGWMDGSSLLNTGTLLESV